ncbi:F-box protein [Quillaja saponaria]|uniref:F-box protein n=1 Tax=Quillaja saponaria TaxID=32244 RepID=A0AAD7PZM3_QUISA|nr:F-box protein [Quillaja saponaria]
MPLKKILTANIEKQEEQKVSLLGLPESTLECILERLSPAEVCVMSEVCTYLRDRCRGDNLWKKHFKQTWGKVISDSAYREWQWHLAKRKRQDLFNEGILNGSLGSFQGVWPSLCLGSFLENSGQLSSSIVDDSIMALYMSIHSGKFWFPAQVFKNGGSILCDALLSYNYRTNTFTARHRHGGWQMISENVTWDRLRAPPIEICCPHFLHISDCLDDLKPGDHIEIQWRSCKEVAYNWWYAVIGHLESCDKHENQCRCQYSDILIVDFNNYPSNSLFRRTMLNRKVHGEQSNIRGGGFYGGIRKLQNEEEITRWKKLRRTHNLEPIG